MAPGPFVPTVLAAALIQDSGAEDQKTTWLPKLLDGSTPAAAMFDGNPVVGGGVAQLLVAPNATIIEKPERQAVPSLDATRRLARFNGEYPDAPARWHDIAAV